MMKAQAKPKKTPAQKRREQVERQTRAEIANAHMMTPAEVAAERTAAWSRATDQAAVAAEVAARGAAPIRAKKRGTARPIVVTDTEGKPKKIVTSDKLLESMLAREGAEGHVIGKRPRTVRCVECPTPVAVPKFGVIPCRCPPHRAEHERRLERARRAKDPDKFREAGRRYRAKNPEKARASAQRYRSENVERVRATKRRSERNRRRENPEPARERERRYRERSVEKERERSKVRTARKSVERAAATAAMGRSCTVCGTPIVERRRTRRILCSGRCKTAAYRSRKATR